VKLHSVSETSVHTNPAPFRRSLPICDKAVLQTCLQKACTLRPVGNYAGSQWLMETMAHQMFYDPPDAGSDVRTHVSCWRANTLLSLSPCRLLSLSSWVAFRLCLSISVPQQNVWSCFIELVLRIVPGPGFVRRIYTRDPITRHFTNINTYICPDFNSTLHGH